MLQQRNRGDNRSVFVTVGTTQFDQLIQTVASHDVLQKLKSLGYSKVVFQTGRGQLVSDVSEKIPESSSDVSSEKIPANITDEKIPGLVSCEKIPGLVVEYFQFKPSIREDIEAADLVISHAGAGSVLETLGARKPLLVVINDELMGNHQTELARQLYKDGHLYFCNCGTLLETLDTANFSILKPFNPGKPELFSQFLDKMMGFA